jgi:hypothetical protein
VRGEKTMENNEIIKNVISYHKAAFDSGFNSIVMLQEQTTKAVDNILKQSPWIPSQTKSLLNEWTDMYKKGTQDFKAAADENYAKLEEYFISGLENFKIKTKN